MKNKYKHLMNKEETLNWIRKNYDQSKPNLLITAGAGDIDQLVQPVKEILEKGEK
jgi:UDP-N-acetylmuramate--alanine ligase